MRRPRPPCTCSAQQRPPSRRHGILPTIITIVHRLPLPASLHSTRSSPSCPTPRSPCPFSFSRSKHTQSQTATRPLDQSWDQSWDRSSSPPRECGRARATHAVANDRAQARPPARARVTSYFVLAVAEKGRGGEGWQQQ